MHGGATCAERGGTQSRRRRGCALSCLCLAARRRTSGREARLSILRFAGDFLDFGAWRQHTGPFEMLGRFNNNKL